MNTKFPLLEQLRIARSHREHDIIAPYKKVIDRQNQQINQLTETINKFTKLLANPIKDELLREIGYSIKERLTAIIEKTIISVSKNRKPIKLIIYPDDLVFTSNAHAFIENSIIREYERINLPKLSLAVNINPSDNVPFLRVDIPSLHYNQRIDA